MPRYHYKAKNKEGEMYEGTAAVPDKFALYTQIREEGGEMVEVKEVGTSSFSIARFNEMFGNG